MVREVYSCLDRIYLFWNKKRRLWYNCERLWYNCERFNQHLVLCFFGFKLIVLVAFVLLSLVLYVVFCKLLFCFYSFSFPFFFFRHGFVCLFSNNEFDSLFCFFRLSLSNLFSNTYMLSLTFRTAEEITRFWKFVFQNTHNL